MRVSSQPVLRPPAADFLLADRIVRPAQNRIEGPAGSVQVEPKVMEVLVCLARQPGAVVGKEELVREVWEGRFVSDDVVWRSIRELRRALGDDARSAGFIETIPKRGYRLLPPVGPPPPREVLPTAVAVLHPITGVAGTSPPAPAVELDRPGPDRRPHSARHPRGRADLPARRPHCPSKAPCPTPRPGPTLPRGRAARPLSRRQGDIPGDREGDRRLWEAIALDPAAAGPRAGLADAYHLLAVTGRRSPDEAYPPAEAAARAALARDPGSAEAHTVLGSVLFRFHWDYAGAERELRQALAADPDDAPAHHDYAWFLVSLGRPDEALAEIRRARALQPLSLRAMADVGWVLYRSGRTDEAIAAMRRLLDLEPGFTAARQCLERALFRAGRETEALAVTRDALRREGASPAEVAALTAGNTGDARRRVAAWRLARLESRPGYISPYAVATLRAEAGDVDGAFAALEQALVHRDPAVVLLAVDPELVALRTDRRFPELLRRLGLAVPPSAASS